jgi:SAM-dependent methyltransferase
MPRNRLRLLLDRAAFPLLVFLTTEQARRLHLTPLDHERTEACLPYCTGLLLDVGCGPNELVRCHGRGVGVDVYHWPEIDILCDTRRLPFPDASFDTATLLAVLNHIPPQDRKTVLKEVHRVLRPAGRLLITMLDPVIGRITHRLRFRQDPDQQERGMLEEEDYGLWDSEVRSLLKESGFQVERRRRFVFGLNNLYVATRASL